MGKKNQKYQWTAVDTDGEDQWVSRSHKKRDSTALQAMGVELCALSDKHLRSLALTEDLIAAVFEWKRINDHEGRRRQMQYIGRLMREESDPASIRAALDAIADGHAVDTRRLQTFERLRDTLMTAPEETLPELCAPLGEKAAEILELARKARAEKVADSPPHAFRALFKALRG